MAASRTTGVIEPETRSRRTLSSVVDVADAGQRREGADGHVAGEPQLDLVVGEVAEGLDAVDLDEDARRG